MALIFCREGFLDKLKLIGGSPGTAIEKLDCGCVLTGTHDTEKHTWTFILNYSKCNHFKRTGKWVIGGDRP